MADADRFFARLDSDHDGEIIPDELAVYERRIAPEIQLYAPGQRLPRAKDDKPDKHAGDYGGPLGAGRWAFLNTPEPVASADEDFNRAITRDEFRAAAKARFALLDTQRRGWLDPAGLPMTPAQAAAVNCVVAPVDPARKRPG